VLDYLDIQFEDFIHDQNCIVSFFFSLRQGSALVYLFVLFSCGGGSEQDVFKSAMMYNEVLN
jgi:hypothetical protein